MIYDTWTVMRKEFREIISMRGSRRGAVIRILFPAIFIGVFFPLNSGLNWIESPVSLSTWFMISYIFVSSVIADSFAGERERHTLETLLSTRLSEKAILLGKICAAMIYALGIASITVILSLITVSLAFGEGGFLLFPPEIALLGIVTGFLTASIAANAGTLISLRAETARQAQQTLGLGMMIVFFTPMILFMTVPETFLKSMDAYIEAHDPAPFVFGAITFFLVVDIVLFMWALARFKRSRML